MTEIGERKRGKDIGYSLNTNYIWIACPKCLKERWVELRKGGQPRAVMCRVCANTGKLMPKGKDHWCWKGGKKLQQGYIFVWIDNTSPFFSMGVKGYGSIKYIPEHRLIMAKHLGRCLLRSEIVHHKNGIKTDNRIENLELMPNSSNHNKMLACSHCELRKEIRLVRWQIKEQGEQIRNLTSKLMGV